jgi:hypothetical protein
VSEDVRDNIRRRGCVVIRNVVDDADATAWKDELKQYVTKNPVEGKVKHLSQWIIRISYNTRSVGFPEEDKQFFQL